MTEGTAWTLEGCRGTPSRSSSMRSAFDPSLSSGTPSRSGSSGTPSMSSSSSLSSSSSSKFASNGMPSTSSSSAMCKGTPSTSSSPSSSFGTSSMGICLSDGSSLVTSRLCFASAVWDGDGDRACGRRLSPGNAAILSSMTGPPRNLSGSCCFERNSCRWPSRSSSRS